MPSLLSPLPQEWATSRPTLRPAVAQAAIALAAGLPEGWEVHVQPPMNGLVPDLALLHPQRGLVVLRVDEGGLSPTERAEAWKVLRLCQEELAAWSALPPDLERHCLRIGMLRATLDARGLKDLVHRFKVLADGPSLLPKGVDLRWRRWLQDDRALERTGGTSSALRLTPAQREIVVNASEVRARRIQGVAGSGKSLVLAARAARLAAEGKRVLIVSFNLTLPAYLMDLVAQQQTRPEGMANITAMNFHAWAKRVACLANRVTAYREVRRLEGAAFNQALGREAAEWAAALPQSQRWDALLVDEGQDFLPEWWTALRAGLRGTQPELLLACDRAQNIYDVRPWTEAQMAGAGFRGPWLQLETSMRVPPSLCPMLQEFARRFLPLGDTLPPQPPQGVFEFDVRLAWENCHDAELAQRCAEAVMAHRRQQGGTENPEVVCVVPTDRLGMRVVSLLRAAGLQTVYTFGEGKDDWERKADSRRKKLALRPGSGGVIVTTMHSYKGWEGRSMVVAIPPPAAGVSKRLVYTAMTRLRNDARGAALTVVCADASLQTYGELWPEQRGMAQRPFAA